MPAIIFYIHPEKPDEGEQYVEFSDPEGARLLAESMENEWACQTNLIEF